MWVIGSIAAYKDIDGYRAISSGRGGLGSRGRHASTPTPRRR
jgi:hypothetical protein